MHELSIALSVLDLVAEEARRRGSAVITAVHVKLGPLSGVTRPALASAYDLAREGTAQSECELVVEETPVIVHCRRCGAESPVASVQDISCSRCGQYQVDVVGGRELEVTALEIEE